MNRGNLIGLGVVVALIAGLAYAQIANSNYMAQGGQRWVVGGQFDLPAQSVALTSPTVTFDVTNKTSIALQSDANLTGIKPTGGIAGQLVVIRTGSGSNTLRFDDNATTMSIGGNITLTEGQDDVIGLVCTGVNAVSGNNTWARVFSADN